MKLLNTDEETSFGTVQKAWRKEGPWPVMECHRLAQLASQPSGEISVLVLRWERSWWVTNRHKHQRVFELNVISQSEHQNYIIEENKEVRWYIEVIWFIMTLYTKQSNAYIKTERNQSVATIEIKVALSKVSYSRSLLRISYPSHNSSLVYTPPTGGFFSC